MVNLFVTIYNQQQQLRIHSHLTDYVIREYGILSNKTKK